MDLVDKDQIFRVEDDQVHYLQLRSASIETDSLVHTPIGFRQANSASETRSTQSFHQPNSAGRLRSVESLEEACDLGQKAAIGLRKLTDDAVP